jgi:hypothetical protein
MSDPDCICTVCSACRNHNITDPAEQEAVLALARNCVAFLGIVEFSEKHNFDLERDDIQKAVDEIVEMAYDD